MKINKTKILLFEILILLLPLKTVMAAGECVLCGGQSSPEPSAPSNPSGGTGPGFGSGCGVTIGSSKNYSVNFDIYDTEGNEIGSPFEDRFKNAKFTAGRFVGIDAYEETRTTKTGTAHPYCWNVVRVCRYKYTKKDYSDPDCSRNTVAYNGESNGPGITQMALQTQPLPAPKPSDGICRMITTYDTRLADNNGYGECPISYNGGILDSQSLENRPCNPPSAASCNEEVKNALKTAVKQELGVHYDAMRYDVNDINAKNDAGNTKTIKIKEYISKSPETEPTQLGPGKFQLEAWIKVKYNLQQACIDGRTGEIDYIHFDKDSNGKLLYDSAASKCRAQGGLPVKKIYNSDNEPVGQYFIPLNSKTISEFSYILSSKDKEPNGKLCQNLIDNYKSDERWRQLMLGSHKEPLTNVTMQRAKDLVANGCYYAIAVSFRNKIEQKFYGEEKDEKGNIKLIGYQPFYRPIDTSKPFPNGLDKSSIWYKLYDIEENKITVTNKSKKTTVTKLSDSFSEISYITTQLSTNAIKNINGTLYTSWERMNNDGTSTNINGTVITRKVDTDTLYNLGCGPSNSDWEGCDNK